MNHWKKTRFAIIGTFVWILSASPDMVAAESGFSKAMAAGRATFTGHWSDPIDFELARTHFRHALAQASSDRDQAAALLALSAAYRVVMKPAYLPTVLDIATRVLALEHLSPQQRAEAYLGMAEARLAEMDYAASRTAIEAAIEATSDMRWRHRAHLLLALSAFQQRQFVRAQERLTDLLEHEELDRQVRWEAEGLLDALSVLPRLRMDRPRLFINADLWPAIRQRAETGETALFHHMRERIADIPISDIRAENWGMHVMEAAFVYTVTGDPDTLDKVRTMLRATIDHLHRQVEWNTRSSNRVGWLAALDWTWNDLAPVERESLASDMLAYLSAIYAEDRVRGSLPRIPHYYEREVYWYAGLALICPDANDYEWVRALRLLAHGYRQNREAISGRLATAGNDGAWQVNCGYSLAHLPYSHAYNFMYSWVAATGSDVPDAWWPIGVPPNWALRQVVGMGESPHSVTWGDRRIHHFGYSRTQGMTPGGDLYDHLAHFMHFFGQSHPDHAAIAHHLRRRIGDEVTTSTGLYPVFRFLMTDAENAPPPILPRGLPIARHFEGVGQVLMSSGFAQDDTYALFIIGGGRTSPVYTTESNHFDAKHFTIYRGGYLALDSGVQNAGTHSANYYNQTVAHNAILIRMPGETFRGIPSNSGGQNRLHNHAVPLAFESRRQYAYAATDVTPTYHEDKCEQMIRQFLYLPPDHFVVFDRVISTHAEYPKTWLLHTANEPVMMGPDAGGGWTFRADQGRGRMFCRTVYPRDAVIETIGGPGREFWADGRNWPIPEGYRFWNYIGMAPGGEIPEHLGRWRVEVRPGAPREEDVFLHLIQTSDQSVEKMVESRVREVNGRIELTFQSGPRVYEVALNKRGPVGGHIQITEDGRRIEDRPLANNIMPQTGLARAE